MQNCPSCGSPIDDFVLYCPSCGSKVSSAQVAVPPPPMPQSPTPYSPYFIPQPLSFGDADRHALKSFRIFAIILLAGIVSVIVVFAGLGFLTISSQYFLSALWTVLFIGAAVELFSLLELWTGLRALVGTDRWHFGTPSKLLILAVIAIPLISLGVYLEFSTPGLLSSVTNQNSVNATQIVTTHPTIIAAAFLDLIGGILAFIGFIGGVMLGLWRIGSRYNETIIKVGTILLVIPLIDTLSPILFLIGIRNAARKVEASKPPG